MLSRPTCCGPCVVAFLCLCGTGFDSAVLRAAEIKQISVEPKEATLTGNLARLQLVRDWTQRRVSRVTPDDSLILRKATLAVAHGGGLRFRPGSHEYEVLAAWVAGGTPPPAKSEPEVVDLTVTPAERVYQSRDS